MAMTGFPQVLTGQQQQWLLVICKPLLGGKKREESKKKIKGKHLTTSQKTQPTTEGGWVAASFLLSLLVQTALPELPCQNCPGKPLLAVGQVICTPQSHFKLPAKDQEMNTGPLEWLARGSFSALGFLVFHCSLSAYTMSDFHTSSVC